MVWVDGRTQLDVSLLVFPYVGKEPCEMWWEASSPKDFQDELRMRVVKAFLVVEAEERVFVVVELV